MRKKLQPLVEAMRIYSDLDERDKQTLADWIKSQTLVKARKSTSIAGKKVKSGEKFSTTLVVKDVDKTLGASGD